jgi:hypothetical protein
MPIPSFVAAGSLVANITNQTLPLVAPTCAEDDVLFAQIINKALGVAISAPAGWTQIYQADADCTTAADDHRAAIFWKRAASADSGATFNFTKASGTVLFAGVLSAWRGCNPFAPLDKTAATATTIAAAVSTISFPGFNPVSAECHVVFMGFFGNDLTTAAAAMSADTNPDCTTRYDLESASGNDCTLCCTSGDNDGANVVARTWAMAPTANAGSTGVVFGLVSKPLLPNNYRQSPRSGDGITVTEKIR